DSEQTGVPCETINGGCGKESFHGFVAFARPGGGWLGALSVSKFSFAAETRARALVSAGSIDADALTVRTISSATARKACAWASLSRRWFRGAEPSRLHKATPSA